MHEHLFCFDEHFKKCMKLFWIDGILEILEQNFKFMDIFEFTNIFLFFWTFFKNHEHFWICQQFLNRWIFYDFPNITQNHEHFFELTIILWFLKQLFFQNSMCLKFGTFLMCRIILKKKNKKKKEKKGKEKKRKKGRLNWSSRGAHPFKERDSKNWNLDVRY